MKKSIFCYLPTVTCFRKKYFKLFIGIVIFGIVLSIKTVIAVSQCESIDTNDLGEIVAQVQCVKKCSDSSDCNCSAYNCYCINIATKTDMIHCDTNGNIVSLSLGTHNGIYYGSVPDLNLTKFKEVTGLFLGDISPPIPDFSTLTEITDLGITVIGPIPDFSTLTKLESLFMTGSYLTGSFPNYLNNFVNLKRIDIFFTQLTGSIPELSNLTNLDYFYLTGNQMLTGSIPDLSNLTNLRQLYLYQNRLTGSIPDLSNLTNLSYLDLSGNQLTGSIPELSYLEKLEFLFLYNNQLSGCIPDLSNLRNLTILDLSGNQLTGCIPDLSNLTELERIDLSGNQFSGAIPNLNKLINLKQFIIGKFDAANNKNRLCRDNNIDYSRWTDAMSYPICSSSDDYVCGCFEIVDPACSEKTVCKGEYLQDTENIILKEPNDLIKNNVTRTGITTDGVTMLLLRMPYDKAVTFTAEPSDCKFGTLMKRDGSSSSCGSLTVEPEKVGEDSYVFAIYKSPPNFPSDSEIPEKITIQAKNSSGDEIDKKELELHPPPVILVHGVWDSPSSWSWIFEPSLKKKGYEVYKVDHNFGTYPAGGSFDPNDSKSIAILQLIGTTRIALGTFRSKGIAVSQVDVVGHSMGGLIARATVKSQIEQYKRLDNYNKGDFHKIITIGTPHFGTRLADVLVYGKCRERNTNNCTWNWNNRQFICQPERLETLMKNTNHQIGPAVYGFQTGSTAINNIGETPVPSHAIVGIAPTGIFAPNISPSEVALNILLRFYALKTVDGLQTVDEILGGNANHDTIVPAESQRGGLSGSAVSEFNDVDHLGEIGGLGGNIPIVIPGVIPVVIELNKTAPKICDKVIQLLGESTDSASFGYFTARPSTWKQSGTLNFKEDENICQTAPRRTSRAAESVSDAVITFSPTPGTVINSGQKVTVSLDIQGGSIQNGVLFSIDGQFLVIDGTPPYTFEFAAPDYKAGKIKIYAQTKTDSETNETYAVESYIIVKPTESPVSVSVFPETLSLSQNGDLYPLQITGIFSNNTEMDITSSEAGTSYTAKSGTENVVAVTAEGIIEARGKGQETIVITNSGKTAQVIVNVQLSDSGENLSPVANASTDQTVNEGATVTLDGSGSSDPDDGIDSYQWTQTAGTSVTLSDSKTVKPTFTAPNVGTNGEKFTFRLIVTDKSGKESNDEVSITVRDAGTVVDNCPDDPNKTEPGVCGCGTPDTDTDGDKTPDCKDKCPNDPNKTEPGIKGCGVADDTPSSANNSSLAGPDQTVNERSTVTLQGSPVSGAISYQWTMAGKAPDWIDTPKLSDPNSPNPTFTAPEVGKDGGSMVFQLTVTDSTGKKSSDVCNIKINNVDSDVADDAEEGGLCFIGTVGR